ncbi:MAG: tetratricopeptide repeat protein [Alistipes senegalensis]|nr:tetratricopeptide repeat protein [Alistipes senegalensis]
MYTKADILRELYQFTRAISYFEKVMEIDNSDYEVQFKLFEIYMITGQPEKAVYMGKILENHGLYSVYDNEIKIYFTECMIEQFAILGRKDSAEEHLKKLRTLQNVDNEVLNFYCVLVENM